MKKLFISLAAACAVALLAGCASSGDVAYYKAQEARANAEAARYKAMGAIGAAAGASDVARVASVMALQDRGGGAGQAPIAAPRSAADYLLQAVGVLAPAIVQGYGIRQQTTLGMRQSDNSARATESTNATFLGLASRIQAPAANVSTITTTTDNSSRVRTDNSVHTADSGNTTSTSTWGANSGANSGNSGRLAGRDNADSTHAPTVVTQPAPVVVTQPAPIVVQMPAPAPAQ